MNINKEDYAILITNLIKQNAPVTEFIKVYKQYQDREPSDTLLQEYMKMVANFNKNVTPVNFDHDEDDDSYSYDDDSYDDEDDY